LLKKTKFIIANTVALFVLLIAFQNCAPNTFQGAVDNLSSKNSGNGNAYEGKPEIYYYFDSQAPCSDKDLNGKPLANKQFFLYQNKNPDLVRNNCSDLATPVSVPLASLTFSTNGSGTFSYQGNTFQPQTTFNEFAVVAASCPAGYSPKAGAIRKNLIKSSQDFLSADWFGIPRSLDGTLGGLPRYQLTRDVDNLIWYTRMSQAVTLSAGKTYAATFFAQKGNIGEACFSTWQDNETSMSVYFDLNTGAGRTVGLYGSGTPFSGISFANRPFAGGMIVTVFFTAPADYVNYMGITPAAPAGANVDNAPSGSVGDNIFATAMQLEDVDNYCTKP
jgi:hypothetical protein